MAGDAEREARINLKTVADTTGAKETAKDLGNVEKATVSLDKASNESQKTTEKLTLSKKGLKEGLKGLGLEFHGVTHFVKLLLNPLSALGVALAVVAGKFLEWKASIEEVERKQTTFKGIDDSISSLAENLAKFEAEAAAAGDGFSIIGKGSQSAAEGVARLNAEIERNRQLQDELSDKGLALTKARIKARVELGPEKGGLTRVQGLEAEAAAEDQSRRDKERREIETREAKVANLKKTLAGVPDLSPEDLAHMERGADMRGEVARQREEKLRKAVAENEAEIKSLRTPDAPYEQIFYETTGVGDARANARERRAQQLERDNEDARKEIRNRRLQAEAAKRRLESGVESRNVRRSLTRDIGLEEKQLGERRSFLEQAGGIERATGAANVEAEGFKRAREERVKARRMDREQDEKVNQALREELKRRDALSLLDTLLQLMRETQGTTSEVLRNHRDKIAELQRRIADNRVE